MSFKVEIRNKANKAFDHAKQAIKKNGGSLKGNVKKGEFQGSGVKGNYKLADNNVFVITITKKPWALPDSLIQGKVKSFFQNGGY